MSVQNANFVLIYTYNAAGDAADIGEIYLEVIRFPTGEEG